jgi:hypothetical protein
VTTAADRLKRVEAQLAAGEFGPALETAKSASDAAERTGLLKTRPTERSAAFRFRNHASGPVPPTTRLANRRPAEQLAPRSWSA